MKTIVTAEAWGDVEGFQGVYRSQARRLHGRTRRGAVNFAAGAAAAALGYWIGSLVTAKENTDQLDSSVDKLTNGVLDLPTRSLPPS